MLISAHIHKFRSCENVEINDFGDITAFIGRNGAGKTNILKAIEWAAKCFVNSQFIDSNGEDVIIDVVFKIDGKTYKYFLERILFLSNSDKYCAERIYEKFILIEDGIETFLFVRENGLLKVLDVAYSLDIEDELLASFLIGRLLPKNPVSEVLKKFFEFAKSVIYIDLEENIASEKNSFINGRDYKKWNSLSEKGFSSNEAIMKILKMYLDDRATFDELESLIGRNGLGLVSSINIYKIDSGDGSYFINFTPLQEETNFNSSFVLNDLSFGTRRIVRLLTSMLYDKASVALIEQPEDGIHPGLLQKIIQLLRDYANPNQFILTSHSPYVLNRLKPEEIRMVDMKNGKTRVRALGEKEIEIANDFIENEGALSEFIDSIEEL